MKKNQSRREFLDGAMKAGVLSAAGSTSLLAPLVHAMGSLKSVPRMIPEGKSIFKVEGKVYVDAKLANIDTIIKENSVVETRGPDSHIVFIVGKDAHLLRGNSILRLGKSSKLNEGLQLVTGKLLSAFGKRRDSEREVLHQTTTATIGIRGTAVYTEAESDRTYICTCYGKTRLTANTDPSVYEDVKARYHDKPRYIYAEPQNGQLIAPAPIINHTNDELYLLEACQQRRLPRSFAADYDGGSNKPY